MPNSRLGLPGVTLLAIVTALLWYAPILISNTICNMDYIEIPFKLADYVCCVGAGAPHHLRPACVRLGSSRPTAYLPVHFARMDGQKTYTGTTAHSAGCALLARCLDRPRVCVCPLRCHVCTSAALFRMSRLCFYLAFDGSLCFCLDTNGALSHVDCR